MPSSVAGMMRFPPGSYQVFDIDGNKVQSGASSRVRIVESKKLYVKYTRKNARFDPTGAIWNHGKVTLMPGVTGVWKVAIGGYQHIRSDHCIKLE